MNNLRLLIENLFKKNTILRMIFSDTYKKDKEGFVKVTAKPFEAGEEIKFQFTYHFENRVAHSNLSIEELSYFEKRIASIVHLQTSTQINTLIRNLATACASLFIEKLGFIENPNSDTGISGILSLFHKKDVIRGGLLELKK